MFNNAEELMAADAFHQGKLAFQNNHPMSSCEYPVGSSLRAEWMAGWTESRNTDPGHFRSSTGNEHAAAANGTASEARH